MFEWLRALLFGTPYAGPADLPDMDEEDARARSFATDPLDTLEGADTDKLPETDIFGHTKVSFEGRLQDEPIMSVLRPDIPVNHGVDATSWLGGLPKMPAHIAWPTTQSTQYPNMTIALNFIGQICCADLPDGLWGGRGPREGWLLFFQDAQEPDPAMTLNAEACQVIYVNQTGPEQQPPRNIWPTFNPVYAGNGPYLRFPDDAPVTWRRCPVTPTEFAVKAEQSYRGHDGGTYDPFGPQDLFPGLPAGRTPKNVDENSRIIRVTFDPSDPQNWPFTRRGAVYVLDYTILAAKEQLAGNRSETVLAQNLDFLAGGDAADTLRNDLANHNAKLSAMIAEAQQSLDQIGADAIAERDRLNRRIPFLEKKRAADAEMQEKITPLIGTDCEDLIAHMQKAHAAFCTWKDSIIGDLTILRGKVVTGDPDDPFPSEAFAPVYKRIWGEGGQRLWITKDRDTGFAVPEHANYNLQLWFTNALKMTQEEAEFDALFGTAKAAQAIPGDRKEEIEVAARVFKRPFKMGGFHDGIQSDATDYAPHLLFQSGDSPAITNLMGALYIFIDGEDLDNCAFDKIRWVVEY